MRSRTVILGTFLYVVAFGSDHLQAQTLAQRVAALERRETAARLRMPPVGSVIGVALTPSEVRALAPVWVPADGSLLNDPQSPLNGRRLPDLTGRVLLGVAPSVDASVAAAGITVGGDEFDGDMTITGNTQRMIAIDCTPFMDEAKNAFGGHAAVNDTPEPESACQHTHPLSGTFKVNAKKVLPPFRGIVYVIRVR